MYLEMLQGGNRQSAPKFLKRYQHTLASEHFSTGRISEILDELSFIACTQDINSRPLVKAFRYVTVHSKQKKKNQHLNANYILCFVIHYSSCKYHCHLSARSSACLKKYLTVQGHVVLFQVSIQKKKI